MLEAYYLLHGKFVSSLHLSVSCIISETFMLRQTLSIDLLFHCIPRKFLCGEIVIGR